MRDIVFKAAVFLAGASIASFLNVYALRSLLDEDYVKGRSHCPYCYRQLTWWETFPLLGFLILRGRCRHCHKRISFRYPLVELTGGFVTLLIMSQQDSLYNRIIMGLFCALLLVISLFDLDTMEVQESHLIFLAVLSLLYVNVNWGDRLLGAVIVSIPFMIINRFKLSFGEGDIILAAIMGFMTGSAHVLRSVTFAVWLGTPVALILILSRRKIRGEIMPFIPFLSAGFLLALVF